MKTFSKWLTIILSLTLIIMIVFSITNNNEIHILNNFIYSFAIIDSASLSTYLLINDSKKKTVMYVKHF